MSALAREILGDLATEFRNGASVYAICEWLGEPRTRVVDALEDLQRLGLIRHQARGGYCVRAGIDLTAMREPR